MLLLLTRIVVVAVIIGTPTSQTTCTTQSTHVARIAAIVDGTLVLLVQSMPLSLPLSLPLLPVPVVLLLRLLLRLRLLRLLLLLPLAGMSVRVWILRV